MPHICYKGVFLWDRFIQNLYHLSSFILLRCLEARHQLMFTAATLARRCLLKISSDFSSAHLYRFGKYFCLLVYEHTRKVAKGGCKRRCDIPCLLCFGHMFQRWFHKHPFQPWNPPPSMNHPESITLFTCSLDVTKSASIFLTHQPQ